MHWIAACCVCVLSVCVTEGALHIPGKIKWAKTDDKVKPGGGPVVGGLTAAKARWPWMAMIKVGDRFVCGGTLISKGRVLTAKHCIDGYSANGVQVVLGEHDRNRDEGTEKTISVKSINTHSTVDLAVLELDQCASTNTNVDTIPLATNLQYLGQSITAIGWGWTNSATGTASLAIDLQQITVPRATNSQCQQTDGLTIGTHEFCGGHATGPYANVCHQDSGGPVMTKQWWSGKYQLSGVIVGGTVGCPTGYHYALFISVSHSSIKSWIQTYIDDDSCGDGGGSSCFPASAQITLASGQVKTMEEVQVGDKVLAMTPGGVLIYSDVIMMMHRSSNLIYRYYVIQTSYRERTIRLTSKHMLYVQGSGEHMANYRFAKDVMIGDFVFVTNNDGSLVKAYVTNITTAKLRGAYAPLTTEGTLVVDKIIASCYAYLESQNICHAVFSPARLLYHWFSNIFKESEADANYMHWYPKMFYTHLGQLINIETGLI